LGIGAFVESDFIKSLLEEKQMKRKNGEKWLSHTIRVLAFVAIIVLAQSCASFKTYLETEKKINTLTKTLQDSGKTMDSFAQAPLVGETVLAEYQDTEIETARTKYSQQEVEAAAKNKTALKYDNPVFNVYEAAAILLVKASDQFPDVDINDMDVRSLQVIEAKVTGPSDMDIAEQAYLNNKTNSVPVLGAMNKDLNNPPTISLDATANFTFKGVVVKKNP